MTLYPGVQKRAQDEIDRVVGKERLPSIEDQDSLVYVGALIKEVLRFAPVAPLGKFYITTFVNLLISLRSASSSNGRRHLHGISSSTRGNRDRKHLVRLSFFMNLQCSNLP